MSRLAKTVKGVGVLDRFWTETRLSVDDSDYTEAESKPGTMSTDSTYARLIPQILDQQSADAVLTVVASGFPGPGVGIGQAEVVYRLETETEEDNRYLDLPLKVTDWRVPGVISGPEQCDTVTFPSGKVLHYWVDNHADAFLWDPYTETYAAVTTFDDGSYAFAVVPGTERVLMLGSCATGPNRFSDDYGVTWVEFVPEHAPFSIAEVSPATRKKIRAGFDAGGNISWAGIDQSTGAIGFMASADLGVTWEEVALVTSVSDYDMAQHPEGSLVVAYISTSASDTCRVAKLGSAYDSLITASAVDPFANSELASMAFQSIIIGVDYAGVIWVFAEDDAENGKWAAAVSYDGGETFFADWYVSSLFGTETPYAFSMGNAGNRINCIRLAPSVRGGLIGSACFGRIGAAVGNGGVYQLGGWRSNPKLPILFGVFGDDNDRMWQGWRLPALVGADWTTVGAGTSSLVVGGGSSPRGYVRLEATGTGQDRYYTALLSTVARTKGQASWCCKVVDDGGSAQCLGVSLETQDDGGAGDKSNITCFLQEDGFRVRDVTSGAFLGPKVSVDLTIRTHFEMQTNIDGTPVVLYRQDGSTKFTVTTWSAPTTAVTATADSVGAWGILAAGVANAEILFWYVQMKTSVRDAVLGRYATDEVLVGGSVGSEFGQSLPDLAANTRPSRLVLHGGVGMVGETYDLPAAPDYALGNVFPDSEPSPSRVWRSSQVGANEDIAVDRGSDAITGQSFSIVLFVGGANARFWRLGSKEDGGSSYTALGTMDLAVGFEEVGFSRTGQVVMPGTGSAGARYVQDGECNGGRVIFDPNGTPVVRPIVKTVAGFWDVTATGPRAVLILGDIDGTEPTSGDVAICWPSGVMVAHLTTADLTRYIRVRCLGDNVSSDAYYSAGVIGVFGLRAYGKDWGNGWEIDQMPNSSAQVDSYGTERRQNLGPDRRSLTKSWDHGLKLDRLRGQTDADYIGAVGAAALAAQDEVWQRLVSIWRESYGGSKPVVVMFDDPGDGSTMTDPTKYLYCYPNGSVRMQHALGSDEDGIFIRVGPIGFTEIV